MWASLLSSLAGHLELALLDVQVVRNASAQVWERPTVTLARGPTQRRATVDWTGGVQDIWIECWEHDTDPLLANTALEALEAAVQAETDAWLAALALPGVCVAGEWLGTEPDGDMFRPSVGSRATLRLSWQP